MKEVKRIAAAEVTRQVQSGTTLLVCAYDDEDKYKKMKLQGAISLKEFKTKLLSLPKNQAIVFYCGWPNENSAASVAARYLEKGYANVAVLGGGVEAWQKAGYPFVKSN